MKTYNVVWSERMSINVQAENEQKAREKILNCEHDESQVSSEIDSQPEAFDMNICASGHAQDEDGRCPCTNRDGK